MAPTEPDFLVVGHVGKPHGLRGEVFVLPLTDRPEGTFAPGVVLFPADLQGRRPDPDAAPLSIRESRPFQRGWLVRFGGAENRGDAEAIRGLYLLRPVAELEPLDDGEVFYHQLLGLRVETVDGETVGTVREVYEAMPSDLLEVRTARGTVLIPFQRTVVVDVRPDEGILIVDPPAGLLDL